MGRGTLDLFYDISRNILHGVIEQNERAYQGLVGIT